MGVGVRVVVEPQLGVIVDHVERRTWGYILHSSSKEGTNAPYNWH